ncbi:MAG: histidinol-phosphatase HisJ [Bacillus sp. (in: Bacteria)]|nr:histidinol-phosphatase HisJ [Bacillus sp. (in: firmicutes)]
MYKKDGHIHSPYCPHGTNYELEAYILKGLELGYDEMTFTEHAPLPKNFEDPVPLKDSAMSWSDLEPYLIKLNNLKRKYENKITINIGLEIDYIEGFEKETKQFLQKWGPMIDDSILSVHFIKASTTDSYICLDYSPDSFEKLVEEYQSIEGVYQKYYDTLTNSILAELGPYKPKRVGHITLVRKFQRSFPRDFNDKKYILEALQLVQKQGMSLDINGAGRLKPLCREFYPPLDWVKVAADMNIPLVYGSDAHSPLQLGEGLTEFQQFTQNFSK